VLKDLCIFKETITRWIEIRPAEEWQSVNFNHKLTNTQNADFLPVRWVKVSDLRPIAHGLRRKHWGIHRQYQQPNPETPRLLHCSINQCRTVRRWFRFFQRGIGAAAVQAHLLRTTQICTLLHRQCFRS
jgi:hypothetical protein